MFPCPKKHIYTNNQDMDFFTCIKYNIYIYIYIYYNVITLLCDQFETITYNFQLIFSFFTWQKRIWRQMFPRVVFVCDQYLQ